jgi:hypothetical protein
MGTRPAKDRCEFSAGTVTALELRAAATAGFHADILFRANFPQQDNKDDMVGVRYVARRREGRRKRQEEKQLQMWPWSR